MSRSARSTTSAAIAALALMIAPPVQAAPPRTEVAVAQPQAEGDIPAFWPARIVEAIDAALTGADAQVRWLDADDCDATRCDDTALAGATHLVRVRLVERERVYTLVLEARSLASGEQLESSERCPLCGLAEIVEMSARQSRALVDKLGRRADALGAVRIETRPAGARIVVDGAARGRTPASVELVPGKHRIELSHPGYGTTTRHIDAVADVRESWSVELVPQLDRRGRGLTIAGGVLVGLSVPALVAGSTLLALDGRPYRGRCDGTDVDRQGDCRFRFASNVQGGVLVGLAAALALGGIVMLTQARLRKLGARGRR